MSGTGTPSLDLDGAAQLRVVVVAAQWHQTVMDGLVAGAERALHRAGCSYRLVRVPGSFELPLAALAAARGGADAVVATDGLARVVLDTGVPVGFGLLTCDTEDQALDRAGLPGSSEDKGYEAAQAALATALALPNVPPSASWVP